MKIYKTRSVKTPTRGTNQSAGIDFYVPIDEASLIEIAPGGACVIPLGLKVKLPPGTCMIMFNKSGVCTRTKLMVGACVIDEDYQGEIHAHLINCGREPIRIYPGDKIVQGVIMPIYYLEPVEVDHVSDLYDGQTQRGEGGFGSTGSR